MQEIDRTVPLEQLTDASCKATDRRQFLGVATATATGALATAGPLSSSARAGAAHDSPGELGPLYMSVKWGMIQGQETVLDRFQVCRELGYDGMELDSPVSIAAREIRAASEATGMPVHGLVNAKHWSVRMSSPAEKTRDEAVSIMERALQDAHDFGGFSVLLVPGKVGGSDETHDHVWERSIGCIRRVLPLASRLGVRILIENVWNGFCETPEQLRDYVDEIASPWVGVYFDIGNVVKFSPSEDWIRTLGNRIVKLDVKDWGKQNGFCKIGDGDVHWAEVRQALAEIRFNGWCTAEVGGGDRERLADILARMNRTLRPA